MTAQGPRAVPPSAGGRPLTARPVLLGGVRDCRMAYDEALAARIREILAPEPGLGERRMFGGLCFMLHGHMVCGVVGDTLMLRLNETLADDALDRPHVRPMDFTGRPLRTMVYVDPPGLVGAELRGWVELAVGHAATLPPKNAV